MRVEEERWPGKKTSEPFAKVLRDLAEGQGYNNAISLAKALCIWGNSTVSDWCYGNRAPSPEGFASLLILFSKNFEVSQLDEFINEYCQLLQDGEGNSGAVKGTEFQFARSKRQMRHSETALSSWIEDFCQIRRITL